MKKLLVLSLISILCLSCFSAKGLSAKKVNDDSLAKNPETAMKLNFQPWTRLLKKHVDNQGFVDYKGFQKDRDQVDEFVSYLEKQSPDDTWTVRQQLAFYINAYNAFTVQLILDNYPTESIKDIGSGLNTAFLQKNWTIGGKKFNLTGIEKGLLKQMDEPRIHFAINCASISCPKLMREAYTAAKIDKQLDKAADQFINSDKNAISKNPPKVSMIFKWYKKDFTQNEMSVIQFINQYADTKINDNAELAYKEYDWSLNEKN